MNIDDLNINQFESDEFDDNHESINSNIHGSNKLRNEDTNHDESEIELSYIDYLTSQYIDGELSNYEDYELRDLITKDKDLKSSFDTSIDIYLTMKNDNIVDYDKKFFDETEDLLVSKLFGKEQEKVLQDISLEAFASPIIEDTIIDNTTDNTKIFNLTAFNQAISNGLKGLNYRKISAVAAMLLVFLMSEISEYKNNNSIISFANLNYEVKFKEENISDLMVGNNISNVSINNFGSNNFAADNTDGKLVTNKLDNNKLDNNNELANTTNIEKNNIETINQTIVESIIQTNNIVLADKDVQNEIITSNNVNTNTINTNTINTNINQVPKQVEVPNTFMVTTPIAVDNRLNQLSLTENNLLDQRQKLHVKINSSMSSEFSNSFFADKHRATIMHYSQSMAFEIDKTADIGFEIGYSDLNFDDKALITITKEIPNNTPGSNLKQYTTITVPVEMRKNYSLYWAMGFLEKQLIDYNDLDLMGKVGFGISNEGPQTYLRLNARYELFKEFYLTWGIDTRYMSVNLPLYENLGNVRSTTSFALNYGLQYKF